MLNGSLSYLHFGLKNTFGGGNYMEKQLMADFCLGGLIPVCMFLCVYSLQLSFKH